MPEEEKLVRERELQERGWLWGCWLQVVPRQPWLSYDALSQELMSIYLRIMQQPFSHVQLVL